MMALARSISKDRLIGPKVLLALTLFFIGWQTAPLLAAEELIYRPLVTDGIEHRRVSYPPQAGRLTILADTDVVMEVYRGDVSYWPITREYFSDISTDAEPLEGRLEIIDSSENIRVVEPEPYLQWHPEGVGLGATKIIRGGEVASFYDNYIRRGREAAERLREYQRARSEQRRAIVAWLKIAAQRPDEMPPPPPELNVEKPEPFNAYASEPERAAIISLPEGSYTIRLRGADGEIVPGTERELVSFGPLARGIGFIIRPEDRWTQPVTSFSPDEVIYTTGGTDLFFQPVPVAEFQARRLTRLFRPQSVEVADPYVTVWVRHASGEDLENDSLAVSLRNGGREFATTPIMPFRVSQLSDRRRGYVIEPFNGESDRPLQPDFYAMRVGSEVDLTEVDLIGKGPAWAGQRKIRRVIPLANAWLFTPALVPLAFWLVMRIVFRWRMRGHRTRRPLSVGPDAKAVVR